MFDDEVVVGIVGDWDVEVVEVSFFRFEYEVVDLC